MAKKRIYEDRALTNTELKRRHDDKAASIDEELDKARANVDVKRRADAEKSLVEWTKTYCVGVLLDEAPPPRGEQILDEMERALDDVRPYMIMMQRGGGKSCYVECAAAVAMATGRRRFPVVVA